MADAVAMTHAEAAAQQGTAPAASSEAVEATGMLIVLGIGVHCCGVWCDDALGVVSRCCLVNFAATHVSGPPGVSRRSDTGLLGPVMNEWYGSGCTIVHAVVLHELYSIQ